ncbi:hypothetical protein BH11VER1_BH11VER1_34010 [soil metagenome]
MIVGARLGGFLRKRLPDEHLSSDARDVVKLGAGLIATMAALALSLLVSSAKSSFETVNNGILEGAASRANLDRVLAQYGPESKAARVQLKHALEERIAHLWPKDGDVKAGMEAEEMSTEMEEVGEMIRQLIPMGDVQTILKARALSVFGDGMKLRWSLIGQGHSSIPSILLVVLIFWFTVLFSMLGLLTPWNATVRMVMIACALAVACGVYLILDMSTPFDGFFKVPKEPMENVLRHLGREADKISIRATSPQAISN